MAEQTGGGAVKPKIPLYDNKDFLSGVHFIGIGVLGLYLAHNYPMGSALRMGPGYFPNSLSGLLILFGIYCLVQGLLRPEPLKHNWSPRALIVLPVSLVVFGLLMEHAGFIPALIALIFVGSLAGSKATNTEFRFVTVLLLSIGLTIFSWFVFIWGLGLPYPLIQGFY